MRSAGRATANRLQKPSTAGRSQGEAKTGCIGLTDAPPPLCATRKPLLPQQKQVRRFVSKSTASTPSVFKIAWKAGENFPLRSMSTWRLPLEKPCSTSVNPKRPKLGDLTAPYWICVVLRRQPVFQSQARDKSKVGRVLSHEGEIVHQGDGGNHQVHGTHFGPLSSQSNAQLPNRLAQSSSKIATLTSC